MRKLLVFSVVALGGSITAQQVTSQFRPIEGDLNYGRYDYATGRITMVDAPHQQPDVPVLGFDNLCFGGFFYGGAVPGTEDVDWGINSGPGTVAYEIEIGYATDDPAPQDCIISFYAGTTGFCAATDPGAVLGSFLITGLPGASVAGSVEAFAFLIDIRTAGLVVPPGPIGWGYEFPTSLGGLPFVTGPLTTDSPAGACPAGTVDAWDTYSPPASGGAGTCTGSLFFGGCAPGIVPCASFYVGLTVDDGSVPAAITSRVGCLGLNVPGSMFPGAGSTSVTGPGFQEFFLDDPLGTTPAPGIAFVAISTAPDPFGGYPCGTPIPFLGMTLPGAPGELLIDIAAPNPIALVPFTGALWVGPGVPVLISVGIPASANLIGFTFYSQGVIADLGGTKITVTEAWDLTLGP